MRMAKVHFVYADGQGQPLRMGIERGPSACSPAQSPGIKSGKARSKECRGPVEEVPLRSSPGPASHRQP